MARNEVSELYTVCTDWYFDFIIDFPFLRPLLYTGSSGMFSGVSSLSYNGLYCKLWQTLVTLERDPFPAVAHLASQVIDHLRSKVSRGSMCVL